MITVTQDLINYLNSSQKIDGSIVNAYATVIYQYGSKADGDLIGLQYLKEPDNFYYNLYFLPILKKWGDHTFAAALFSKCFDGNMLKDEHVAEPLELLGVLGYLPAKAAIAGYVFNSDDYYLNRSAVFGLMNYDCEELEADIIAEIEATLGKNLFKEFVPALITKVKHKAALLEALYESGSTTASTDCNGGMILGFSLCGEEGLPYFKKILFDPDWEAGSSATGALTMTYQGMKNLKLEFLPLLNEVKEITEGPDFNYALGVFFHLLLERVNDPDHSCFINEPLTVLYQQLFTWEDGNRRNNIIDVAGKYGLEETAEAIASAMEKGMIEELTAKTILFKKENAN